MKIFMFKVGRKRLDPYKVSEKRVEKVLFLSFFITFILLIITQAAILIPSSGDSFAVDIEMEGRLLAAQEFLYSEGTIVLELKNEDSNSLLKAMVNGIVVGNFENKRLQIAVKDGDVIEIDGSEAGKSMEVAVVSASSNISEECINKKVIVDCCVKQILRVEMKK